MTNNNNEKNQLKSRFDMKTNPVYQINFELQQKGRRISSSKRRAKWSFGFSDQTSLEEGKSGSACRGAEHEVVMIWSLTSGKQRVLADGIEVHFAKAPVGDKFECEWKMNGGHHIQIVAHMTTPIRGGKQVQGFRQYDLKIDGLSYWDMPKLFELGTSVATTASPSPRPHNKMVRARSTTMERTSSPTSVMGHPSGPPRRAQSMQDCTLVSKQQVPVADLLWGGGEAYRTQSDIFTMPPSILNSPTSTVALDPFASSSSTTALVTTPPPTKPGLSRAVSQPTCFHQSYHNVISHTPDTSSVCSSSSHSIDTAPPAPLSLVHPAASMFINNFDSSSVCATPSTMPLSPPSTPFDDFESSFSADFTTTTTPRNKQQQQDQQRRHTLFTTVVPQTVFASGY